MRPAIQLHSVRDLDASVPELIDRVGRAGFEGVEFAAGVRDADAAAVADALAAADVTAVGAHVNLSTLEAGGDGLDVYETVGCQWLAIPHLPATHFRTTPRVRELATRLEAVADRLDDRGLDLLYHNTRYDLAPPLSGRLGSIADSRVVPGAVGGLVLEDIRTDSSPGPLSATALGRLARFTDPSRLGFELDTGEAVAAGYDPGAVFDWFGDRLRAVHLCDVTGESDGYRSTSPGTGILDTASAVAAADRNGVEWLVYEHDHPEDPAATIGRGLEAVETALPGGDRPPNEAGRSPAGEPAGPGLE